MYSVATLWQWHPLVLLVAVTSLTHLVTAANNIPCTFADEEKNQYYDLRPLIKDEAPDWIVEGSHGRKYYLNVCNEIHYEKTGLSEPWGVAAFQSTGDNKGFSIGRMNKTLVLRDDYVVLTYKNGDECGESTDKRETAISFFCDKNADKDSKPKYITSFKRCHYVFNWYTPYACPSDKKPIGNRGGDSGSGTNDDQRQPAKGGGSSFFSILSILVFIYLLIGILYKRFILNARGFEQVPHIDTWHNIFDWCKDMFFIILVKIYPSYGRNRNYSSLRSNYRRSNNGNSGRGDGIVLGGNSRHQHGFTDDDDDDDAVDVLITEQVIEEETGGDGQVLRTATTTNQATKHIENTSPSHSSSSRNERTTTRRGTSEEGVIRLVDTGDEEEA